MSPVLALFRKLVDLCRRCARRSLPSLVELFLFLTSRLSSRRSNAGVTLPDKESGNSASESTISDSPETRPEQGALPLMAGGREVVVSCSSVPLPSPPPQAHVNSRPRSSNSSISYPSISSPTGTPFSSAVYNSGGSHEGCNPGSLSGSSRENTNPDGTLRAEPAGFCASPPFKRDRHTVEPSGRPRYDRDIKIADNRAPSNPGLGTPWMFMPLESRDIYNESQDVSSWKFCVHPEGQPYYHHMGDTPLGFRYLTEARLDDREVLEEVEMFMADIENDARNFHWSGSAPRNVEVVLEVGNKDETWTYYMVDLDRRCIFWIDDYNGDALVGRYYGIETKAQLRQAFEFEFWQHIEYFPSHRKMFDDTFDKLLSTLGYWRIDGITSADSTAPYGDSEFSSIITTVKGLQEAIKSGQDHSYAVTSTARLMGIIASERYNNFYGSHGARLSLWQSVRGDAPNKQSLLFNYISPFLFYTPNMYLVSLEKLCIDGVICDRRWQSFWASLERSYDCLLIISTVLLSVNVSFMDLPNVISDNSTLWASPAAVASQISTIASISCIITGLLQTRAKTGIFGAKRIFSHLNKKGHKRELEKLSIQYSLPYAMLMWSVIAFLTSIALTSFFSVDGTPNTLSRLIYGVIWLLSISFIVWTMLTGREETSEFHWRELLSVKRWID